MDAKIWGMYSVEYVAYQDKRPKLAVRIMKLLTSAVLLILACWCPLLNAQQKHSAQLGKAALEVSGVKLHLGMTKGEVAEKLSGNEISKYNEDNWMIAAPNNLGPTLQFTNGRLTHAERNWVTYDNDITEALFGVVHSLNEEGFATCVVTANTKATPDATSHGVWIVCGEKSILVVRRTFGGKSYNTVDEHLGTMHDWGVKH